MWLNNEQIVDSAICEYRVSLLSTRPNHIVIDNLFDETKLNDVLTILKKASSWTTQNHTYTALYVNPEQWQKATKDQRFVQRDVWQRNTNDSDTANSNANIAHDFLSFLRGHEFLSVLSRIFNVRLTDINVSEPEINTNYFRLGAYDFVEQHADDSPGRKVCMLLYLNKEWNDNAGGELVFIGNGEDPIQISPLYNRCVLFDPSSEGSEHWVKKLNKKYVGDYRYNVTSWYWSE